MWTIRRLCLNRPCDFAYAYPAVHMHTRRKIASRARTIPISPITTMSRPTIPQTKAAGSRLPIVLLTDFDSTLTTTDTLSHLAHLPRTNTSPHPWSYFSTGYVHDLNDKLPPPPAPIPPSSSTTLSQELEHLEAYLPIERASIHRLEKERFFANISPDRLYVHGANYVAYGHIHIREGWWELARWVLERGVDEGSGEQGGSIVVISVNWSEGFIRGVLERSYAIWMQANSHNSENIPVKRIPEEIKIYCNNFLTDPTDGRTTGEFSRHNYFPPDQDRGLWTAADKLAVMREHILSLSSHQSSSPSSSHTYHTPPPLTIFLGDSPTDLPCLFASNLGIVVGTQNKELERVCSRMGIDIIDNMENVKFGETGCICPGLEHVQVDGKMFPRVGEFMSVRRWLENWESDMLRRAKGEDTN